MKKRKIYYRVTELGLSIDSCTLNDIANAMPNYSEIHLIVGNDIYYDVPKNYGELSIYKYARTIAMYHTVWESDKNRIYFNNHNGEIFLGWHYIEGQSV